MSRDAAGTSACATWCYDVPMIMNVAPFLLLLLYLVVGLTVVWLVVSALVRASRAFEDIAFTLRRYVTWRIESKDQKLG